MSVSTEVITPALRACGAIPANRVPSGPEAADALGVFNLMVGAMRGELIGQPVVAKPIAASTTGQPGRMYVYGGATQITVTLPADARAGARIGVSAAGDGAVRVSPGAFRMEGGGSQVTIAAASRVWFHDGAGDWVREADAALSDEVAFAAEAREPLVDMLSLRLAREYGLPVSEEMRALHERGLQRIKRHYNGAG